MARKKPVEVDEKELKQIKSRMSPLFPKPKWVEFIEMMLAHKNNGVKCFVYRSQSTVSKYVYVRRKGKEVKVRFSNHMPAKRKIQEGDSHYYIGVSQNGCLSTTKAVPKILADLGIIIPGAELSALDLRRETLWNEGDKK